MLAGCFVLTERFVWMSFLLGREAVAASMAAVGDDEERATVDGSSDGDEEEDDDEHPLQIAPVQITPIWKILSPGPSTSCTCVLPHAEPFGVCRSSQTSRLSCVSLAAIGAANLLISCCVYVAHRLISYRAPRTLKWDNLGLLGLKEIH